jgi:hypothetical protein
MMGVRRRTRDGPISALPGIEINSRPQDRADGFLDAGLFFAAEAAISGTLIPIISAVEPGHGCDPERDVLRQPTMMPLIPNIVAAELVSVVTPMMT